MSKDIDGYVFNYWPITGLIEGHNSQVLTWEEDTPVPNGFLVATIDVLAEVWARRQGVGSYQNIGTTPLALDSMPAGVTLFECYVKAIGPIPSGMEVVSLFVYVSSAKPAAW